MSGLRIWQYRLSRRAGRIITRVASTLTLERMPPFTSTSAIVTDGENVLVVIDPIRREPILPGGHLKWREKPEMAVVREVREETGYTIEPQALLAVFAGEEWSGEAGVVRVVYEAAVTGGALQESPEGVPQWMPARVLAGTDTRDAPIIRLWLEGVNSPAAGPRGR